MFEKILCECAFDILKHLNEEDLLSLKLSNKSIKEIVECFQMFNLLSKSINNIIGDSFLPNFEDKYLHKEKNKELRKKGVSKFKEKFNFHKNP